MNKNFTLYTFFSLWILLQPTSLTTVATNTQRKIKINFSGRIQRVKCKDKNYVKNCYQLLAQQQFENNLMLNNSLLLVFYFLFFLFRLYIFLSYYCYSKDHAASLPSVNPLCHLPDFYYCCGKLICSHTTLTSYPSISLLLLHLTLRKCSSF